jgi:Lrp/AsnC family transcriptional regulator for asnA, asnC and gidA
LEDVHRARRVVDVNVKLDNYDHQIVEALRQDGRMPYARIASKLGVSPGMVRQRVQRLIEEGAIRIAAITNPIRMGYPLMALVGINVDVLRFREIADQIASFEEVIYLVLATGSYDLLVEVVCRDNAHLVEFLTKRLYEVEGVRDTETFIYLEIVKDTP